MGKKRKTNSPLWKGSGKNPRSDDQESVEVETEGGDEKQDGAVISDLKEFIRKEIARSNQTLSEELRRHIDERVTAVESSLNFALATNETIGKRLTEVEQKCRQAEKDLLCCAKRLMDVEGQLDLMRQ